MKTRALRRTALVAAVASTSALVLAGCSGAGGSASGDGEVTLTIATFNDFGYTDALLQEYMDAHPNVKIVHNKAATSNEARENYFQKLGKTGLADIEAIEVDWLPEVMEYADLLAPVPDDLKSRWLDYKVEAATSPEGQLVGYGTDIGPEGVCYRSDLFAAAGLPTDRAEVAKLLEGDWSTYFSVGDTYVAATGKAFFDSAGGTYQGAINQVEAAYENPDDGSITATGNAEVKDIYDEVLEASATQSAHLGQWSDDWFAGLSNGAFATMLCPRKEPDPCPPPARSPTASSSAPRPRPTRSREPPSKTVAPPRSGTRSAACPTPSSTPTTAMSPAITTTATPATCS